jgi:hypothetical protein
MTADIKYPLSAKEYLVLKNIIQNSTTRVAKEPLNSKEMEALRILYKKTESWKEQLGIVAVNE